MKKPKPVAAPDPTKIIAAQEQANRVNINTPFGRQQYVKGPDGRTTLETSFSPEMEALSRRAMDLAGRDSTRYQLPPGMEKIMGGMMDKIGSRYGQGGGVGAAVSASGGRKPQQPMPMPPPTGINPNAPPP